MNDEQVIDLWHKHGGWFSGLMMIPEDGFKDFVAAISGSRETTGEPDHVDTFIRYGTGAKDEPNEAYARWMLNHFRQPASVLFATEQFMKPHRLFCTHLTQRYRVTGASRMGDVWLTKNFDQDSGYQKRVLISSCYSWGPEA